MIAIYMITLQRRWQQSHQKLNRIITYTTEYQNIKFRYIVKYDVTRIYINKF